MNGLLKQIETEQHLLDDRNIFLTTKLPTELIWNDQQFDEFWARHPDEYHEIMMHGRPVKTPRWQQAYGNDYHYTGNTNKALPTPPILQPLLDWARETINPDLNGILINCYDSALKHYIGPHHDSIKYMGNDAPIVTISFGEERVFRLMKEEGKGKQKKIVAKRDFPAPHGSVFVMPFATNLAWKHCVPHFARYTGKRISVTIRAFETTQ